MFIHFLLFFNKLLVKTLFQVWVPAAYAKSIGPFPKELEHSTCKAATGAQISDGTRHNYTLQNGHVASSRAIFTSLYASTKSQRTLTDFGFFSQKISSKN